MFKVNQKHYIKELKAQSFEFKLNYFNCDCCIIYTYNIPTSYFIFTWQQELTVFHNSFKIVLDNVKICICMLFNPTVIPQFNFKIQIMYVYKI